MNAIIALCHFCEAHGPSSILCTQTLRETKFEDINFDIIQSSNKLCPACNSIGSTGILSRDEKNNISFLSTQSSVFPEVSNLIKQASVRSLSCEISSKKDGGFVFFGDTLSGHILSHTFHVSDLQARGFYQLFSIIIIMKDKYYLLNIKPFLTEHLSKISSEIQTLAKQVRNEEKVRSSPIQRRISGGSQIIPTTPRSLIDLTAENNIFQFIHTNFTWLLLAGSKCLTEHITFGNLPKSSFKTTQSYHNSLWRKTSFSNSSNTEISFDDYPYEDYNEEFSLRRIKELLGNNFTKFCFCVLTGINILIRGSPDKTKFFVQSLKNLLPQNLHKSILIDSITISDIQNYKIVTVRSEEAVPMPCSSIFRVDFLETQSTQICVKWLGEMPNKLPNLLIQITNAVDEVLFTDFVVNKRLAVLINEWKNKVIHLSKIKSTSDVVKFKKVIGVFPQDQPLINYWGQYLR